MAKIISKNTSSKKIDSPLKTWRTLLLGLFLGVLYWYLSTTFGHWLSSTTASDISLIIVTTIGLVIMSFTRTKNPALVAVSTAISLWGLASLTYGLAWYEAVIWSVVIFGLAYAFYEWLSYSNRTAVVVTIAILIMLLVRFIATSTMIQ